MYQARMSGSESSRIVSAVGAQSTTTSVEFAGRCELLDIGEREHLVETRDDGELLGFDRVGAGPVEHADHVGPDVLPCILEAHPGIELLAPEAGSDGRRHIAERDVERVGQ